MRPLPSNASRQLNWNLVSLGNWGSIPNCLSNGPFKSATVSVDVEWSGIVTRQSE